MNNKLIIPLGVLSLGALAAYLVHHFNPKKKKFDAKQIEKSLEDLRMTILEQNYNKIMKSIGDLLTYDWKTMNPKKLEDVDVFLSLFTFLEKLELFGVRQKEQLDLIIFSNGILKELSKKKMKSEMRESLKVFLSVNLRILCSRRLNIALNYNDKIENEAREMWMFHDNVKNKDSERKVDSLCCLVKMLMMKGKYDEVVEKFNVLCKENKLDMMNFKLRNTFVLLFSFWNAALRTKNPNKETISKISNLCKETIERSSQEGSFVKLYFSSSHFDLYFDNIMDKIGPDGISTKLVFSAFKDGEQIDCKVRVKTLDGELIFEEFVPKKILPKDIFEKGKLVDILQFKKFKENTHDMFYEAMGEEIRQYNDVNDIHPKDFITQSLEVLFPVFCSTSSNIPMGKGIFIVSFEVDEGNGKKEEFSMMFINRFTSNDTNSLSLLKKLDLLPKKEMAGLFYFAKHFSDLMSLTKPKNFEIANQFILQKGLDSISLFMDEKFTEYLLIELFYYYIGMTCTMLEEIETYGNITKELQNYLQKTSDMKNTFFTTLIYQSLFDFYEYFEDTKTIDICINEFSLLDFSNLSIESESEILTYFRVYSTIVESHASKGELDLCIKLLEFIHKKIGKVCAYTNVQQSYLSKQVVNWYQFLQIEVAFCHGDELEEELLKIDYQVVESVNRKAHFDTLKFYLRKYFGKREERETKEKLIEHLSYLEKLIEEVPSDSAKIVMGSTIVQLFLCASTRSYLGENKKAVEHLKSIKEVGDKVEMSLFLEHSNIHINNFFFTFKFNSLVKSEKDENEAILNFKIDLCFKLIDLKETYLQEGDLLKFSFVPFSKIDLLEKNSQDLFELSKTESSLICFETKVEKENIVFVSDFKKRALSVSKQVTLFEKETTYVLKAEAFNKEGNLIAVNFLIQELMDKLPHEFLSTLKNYDFISFLKKL